MLQMIQMLTLWGQIFAGAPDDQVALRFHRDCLFIIGGAVKLANWARWNSSFKSSLEIFGQDLQD
jgi:hypothetical protein